MGLIYFPPGVASPVSGASGNLAADYSGLQSITWSVNQNNIALPTGTGFRITPTTNIDWTGMVAAANNTFYLIYNAGTSNIKFKFNNANSAVGNRFFPFTGSDITLGDYASVYIRYDSTLPGWHLVGLQH